MIGECLRQRGLLFLQFGEARLLVLGQLGARQAEIAQRVVEIFLRSVDSVAYSALAAIALYFSYSARFWPTLDQNSVTRGRFSP